MTSDKIEGNIFSLGDKAPKIADDVFVAPGAQIIGDVTLGAGVSIWFNCVLRGDVQSISVGEGTNIQDGTVVHVTAQTHPTVIGKHVLIGHMAMVHGCVLEDRAFIGLSATVMDGCVVEEGGMVAAGSLLPPGKRVKAGEMWVGRPAKFVRMLTEADIAGHRLATDGYRQLGQYYRKELKWV